MSSYDILEEKAVSLAEVHDILSQKKGEFTFREDAMNKYCERFSKLDKKQFEKVVEDLKACNIERVDDNDILKIANILPQTGTELRSIFTKTGVVLVDENVDKILSITRRFR